ncbi:MAG TPA: helix-turn-helix domain-containing protein [Ktedonobacterales bacterium]|nr:helix-turn-helix domain-containing protein [Ktedonobacterales bacterium]
MSIPYEQSGRTHQKARTRRALVEAARELLAQGVTPTVEQAADAAAVSRTTAYRYFPNQRALLVATFPQVTASSLLPEPPPQDPEARLTVVAAAIGKLILEHEPELRAQLRLSLEHDSPDGASAVHRDLPFRTGRAAVWIEEALAPLHGRLPEPQLRRLVLAIRTALGIEALVWLTDVAGLSREEAVELMCWSARALLRSTLEEAAREQAANAS